MSTIKTIPTSWFVLIFREDHGSPRLRGVRSGRAELPGLWPPQLLHEEGHLARLKVQQAGAVGDGAQHRGKPLHQAQDLELGAPDVGGHRNDLLALKGTLCKVAEGTRQDGVFGMYLKE